MCLPIDQIASKSADEERDRKGNQHWMDRMAGNLRGTFWIHGCLQIGVDPPRQQWHGRVSSIALVELLKQLSRFRKSGGDIPQSARSCSWRLALTGKASFVSRL